MATMSDATINAIRRSRQEFVTDMRRLLEEAKQYAGDVAWRLEGDGEVIYGHRGKVVGRRATIGLQVSRFLVNDSNTVCTRECCIPVSVS